MINLQVITASTREGRRGPAVAEWITELAKRRPEFSVEQVDLFNVGLPLYDEPAHPRLGNYANKHTIAWSKIVERADAFVFVTPEYNHAPPASLKNAIDYLYHEWANKSVGFVSYGGVSGGTRATACLRGITASLKMLPVAESVAIPFFGNLIDENGKFSPSMELVQSVEPMFDEIVRYVGCLGANGEVT